MSTICSSCGKEIDENSTRNINKKFVLCSCGVFIPRDSHSYHSSKLKGGNNMAEKKDKAKKEIKEKKKTKIGLISELLAQKKSEEEISKIVAQTFHISYPVSVVKASIAYLKEKKK